jgi:hypothetical protein
MSLNEGKKEEGKTPSLWQGKKSLSLVREKLDTSIKERHPVQEPGIYIVKYSRTPNLESIFHRQQRLLCVCRYSPGRNGLFQGFGGGGEGGSSVPRLFSDSATFSYFQPNFRSSSHRYHISYFLSYIGIFCAAIG